MAPPLPYASPSPGAMACVVALYGILILAGTGTAVGLIARSLRRPIDWAPRVSTLLARPWTWRDAAALIAAVGILISLSVIAGRVLNPVRASGLVILQGLILDGLGIVAVAALIRTRHQSWFNAFGMTTSWLRHLKSAALFYLAIIPCFVFSSLVYQGILTVKGYPPSLQDIAVLLSSDVPLWVRLMMIVLAVGVAPFFEECVFRGILLPILARRLGLGAGIFLSSLLFAAIHMHLPSLAPLLVIATGFALAYIMSGSLWVPIVMHAIFNGVNLLLIIILKS